MTKINRLQLLQFSSFRKRTCMGQKETIKVRIAFNLFLSIWLNLKIDWQQLILTLHAFYNYQILFELAMTEEQVQEISIEDLQLSLEVYEIEAEQKLKKLQALFAEKKTVDLAKMFYEERSSLQIKFQNIVSDLTQFLINQQIASTDKLRKTFYKILQNPLNVLFKVSRFEIFNLRLNAFDIQLQPIDAVAELGSSILTNIQKHKDIAAKITSRYAGGQYQSFEQFLEDAQSKLIQDLIFLFYSYLRKGGAIIRKKFQDKVKVVQLYSKIQQQLLKRCIMVGDVRTLKQLSTLNYQIYMLQNSYDVLCFYLKVPLKAEFAEVFKELQTLGLKAKQNSNYDLFILIFLRYSKEIISKLDQQGIDEMFSPYIQNALISILELWGCRLCYYQQFFDLFCKLLSLHPRKASALLNCLKFNPELKKDDIVLLRTNFKHDLQQKHSQLLSLLRTKTMEQINTSLSEYYHRLLYNLDFDAFSREQLLELLTLLNGNSSIAQFFGITERAFKEWNHTIDFTNPHKYIEGQFKYPTLQSSKLLQSLRLINNLCALEKKGVKDYEQLVKAGSIQKALIGLSSFLFNNQKAIALISSEELVKTLLARILQFLKKTILVPSDWQFTCTLFSSNIKKLSQPYNTKIIAAIRQILSSNAACFGVKSSSNIFANIIEVEKQLKLDSILTLQCINSIFMSGVTKNNGEIKRFRFFDNKLSNFTKITKIQKAFLQKYACLNGQIIEAKDPGCFILSELQIITNPVQFDKVMDNYYFTLDNNSKRFVQLLCTSWTESTPEKVSPILTIVQNLIRNYPIVIPVFCTTRVTVDNVAKRFIEAIVHKITPESFTLLKSIVQCHCIRYKNGRDYIKEEIIPLLLKQTLKLINQGSQKLQHYQLLSLVIANSRPADIKVDLIQASIDIIKYEISQSKTSEQAYRLSQGNLTILKKFFEKKEVDMRKKGLLNLFQEQIWSQIRTKSTLLTTQNVKKQLQRNKIPDQIMISPYTLAQQYETEAAKLQKIQAKAKETTQVADVQISSLKNSLAIKTVNTNMLLERKQQTGTLVDLSRLKYNIQSHLGDEVKEFCRMQGFKIVTAYKEDVNNTGKNDQNVTLVQYYLKQFQNPEISAELIAKYLLSLLSGQVSYCFLFSNCSNLQKLFTFLILLLGYAIKGKQVQSTNPTLIQQLLSLGLFDRQKTIKTILNVFSEIGYTNLWSENYNSLKNIDYLKEIRAKSQFKQEEEDQTFFSWTLRVCLEKQTVKAELNQLLGKIFESRPKQQNALMYKVTLNRVLLNLIMKSLQIPNLSHVSLLFHSNYNNLRLYTDQLHQGLKALNMASKNRAYNQYIQLSKDIEDEEFFNPMKLFKYNIQFFIRIEKEGYKFKKNQQQKLGRERVLKVLRSGVTGQELNKQIQKVIEDYQIQLQKLQYNIASRVKAFYLATKLRDLSYQNSLTVCLLYENLSDAKLKIEDILAKINQIQLFSLIMSIYNTLVRFGKSNQCQNFLFSDEKEVNISSIRRYSFSMSKVYEKCELELDEVIQRCIQGLKYFLATKEGRQWISSFDIYPPFLNKNFISFKEGQQLAEKIRSNITLTKQSFQPIQLIGDLNSLSGVVKSLKQLKKGHILSKDKIKIKLNGKAYTLSQFLIPLRDHLINSQTLSKTKEGYLYFNKYKKSQKTLQEIQILGFAVGYCIVNNIQIDLPLHSSLLSAVGFGVCDLQDLLDINFKVWEDLRNLMSTGESKDLNLNFSYLFESLQSMKSERVELLDKGTSKKVNNLNREQYCDLVCYYLLYKIVNKQVTRFLEGIVYLCPKQLLSSMKIAEIHRFFIKRFPQYSQAIFKQHMRKRGIVLPDSVLLKGKRVQNLKDYQTIQWIWEVVEENATLRDKIWKNESNLIICTTMGQEIDFDSDWGRLVIGRIGSKEELKQALLRLK